MSLAWYRNSSYLCSMNDERLNRHITHENLRLRSENSQLKHQMEAKDSMLQSKDAEILRLLNQIASDMVKRSDVDEIVKNAVAEEHDRMVTFYEEKMRKMAAEYEAIIASLKKKDDKGGKAGRRKKPNTETYATKEEAIAALEEAQKKALESTATSIIDTREEHYDMTMAQLYDPDKMPDDLKAAHEANDLLVDRLFRKTGFDSDEDRLAELFRLYETNTKGDN